METKIKILIVDDDSNHLSIVKSKIIRNNLYDIDSIVGFKKGIEYLNDNLPDLIILDHYLDEGKTSIDFISKLNKNINVPIIILSTFFNEETLEKIKKIHPIDFLSKTCSDFELNKSIEIALINSEINSKNEKIKEYIFIKIGNNLKKIELKDIEMVEVDGKYLNIYANQKKYLINSTLNDFNKKLPEYFIKCHQSFIININYVDFINVRENKIILKNSTAYFSKPFKKVLLKNNFV